MANSFLDRLAEEVISKYSGNTTDLTIILPNKRAKIFLLEALRTFTNKNIFAPRIISIEDLINEISGLRSIDAIEQLFEFYEVVSNTGPKPKHTFDQFANWASTLLLDFNEIDRYLLNADHILSYLKDIEDIKKWGVEPEQKTALLEKYIDFWKLLPTYYHALYDHLLRKKVGYQGMIYREAGKKISAYAENIAKGELIFAGFNALNAAEEKIIRYLLQEEIALIYWDADNVFLSDAQHDAGLFLRRYKRWKEFEGRSFEWISEDYQQPKKISIIGTPKSVGQAKIAGKIVESIKESQPDQALSHTALVLGEENLLLPMLQSLPSSTGLLNITMGFPIKNNPVQLLVGKIFRLHINAISRDPKRYVFYYRDLLAILTHPLIAPYSTNNAVEIIRKNNYSFITHEKLRSMTGPNTLTDLLFEKWNTPDIALASLSAIMLRVRSNLSRETEDDKIMSAFVFSLHTVINKLSTYYDKNQYSLETLFSIYKQALEMAEVSFEGEPLTGLQIMGVLESRVLDFDSVIITSMNEGVFPAGKSQNSFIPYDLKKEFGLPTFKEKDAIYTYHFYHLLQRAKNIYLLYNTESEGIDAGEMSRFITQILIEKQPTHQVTHEIYHAHVPDTAYEPMEIAKTKQVMDRLEEIASKGFSPSALASYMRNPIDFYFQRILRINETDEVEENIALNTLGTIIHETLYSLYLPFIGKPLYEHNISEMLSKTDDEVVSQFRQIYKEGDIKKGRNLLAFEVARRNVSNFLKAELRDIRNGDEVSIIDLETPLERDLLHEQLPFPVKIAGKVDRIENRNGKVRIIDYKTGRVESSHVSVRGWNGLTTDIKSEKIVQILAYAFMYFPQVYDKELEVGIISFKNMRSGFLPFTLKSSDANVTVVTEGLLNDYISELVILLKEILDPTIPFTESI